MTARHPSFSFAVRALRALVSAFVAGLPIAAWAQLADPFLWELTKPGSNTTVTLFGSLHVGRSDFYPLPEAVQKRFDAAKVLAVEADILLPSTQQICDRLARTDVPLDRQLPAEEFAALQAYLRASNLPPRVVEGKKLWLVNLVLTAVELAQLGMDFNRGVDITLLNAARNTGKRIVEVEGAARQCGSLAQASDAEAIAAFNRFMATIRENRMEKRLTALLDLYRAGDGPRLLEVIDDEFGTTPLGRRARARLFEERHPHMADAIAEYFTKPEPHFVVIGVGHLLGSSSLLDALAKKGITAKRVTDGK
ncbi:MAG: TraB/GumN family protein [Casimicrobiaceae bacterium]